jgi:peptidoglycan/xylan/chitin deacetylase (PgdA/CDA1 family)
MIRWNRITFRYMTSFSSEDAFAELYYTREVIKEILGVTPTCWRPPYGDVDNRIRLIAAGLNLTTIVWSDDTVSDLTSTAQVLTQI